MAAGLVGLRGTLVGKTLVLSGETTLGREPGNTVVLDDQTVGRRHARIALEGGQWTLHDLGSSNGCFVNDQRVSTVPLQSGDTIQIGGQLLRFEGDGVASSTAAPPRVEVGRREAAAMPFTRGVENPGLFRSGTIGRDLGCLDVNLEGCVRWLIIFLIVCAAAALIALLGSGLMGGMGAIGGAFGGGGGGGGGVPAGGSSPAGGSESQQGAGGGQQQGGGRQQEGGPVRIVDVRVTFASRNGYSGIVPVVLVTWQNVGDKPLTQVRGSVTGFGPQGENLGEASNVWIYSGEAVAPGAEHRDTVQQGGIVVEPGVGNTMKRAPRTATVTVQDAR